LPAQQLQKIQSSIAVFRSLVLGLRDTEHSL
jgi:hypothetical protein